jgi:hypothetical protein
LQVLTLCTLLSVGVVIFGVSRWLALLHQATAVVTFAAAVHLNHRLATGCSGSRRSILFAQFSA